jgi:hypothetical protein
VSISQTTFRRLVTPSRSMLPSIADPFINEVLTMEGMIATRLQIERQAANASSRTVSEIDSAVLLLLNRI